MSSLCVLVISGFMSITPARAQDLVNEGNQIIGITENVRYIPMRNRYPIRYTEKELSAQNSLTFSRWKRYVDRKRSVGSLKCNVHVLDIPLFTGSATLAGGRAYVGSACRGLGFSVSNARETSYEGANGVEAYGTLRLGHSVRIYVHERLHTFGALHNDDVVENMMNSYVMGDINAIPPILESTRKQMCL